MNTTLEMDPSNENVSMVHLDAPIFPERSAMSNLTIIQTSNGSLIESDGMFLNTAAAQALSGIFVWSALLITCHQVRDAQMIENEICPPANSRHSTFRCIR